MPFVLTNSPEGETAREFVTDRKRFPPEGLFTTDLAKAATWSDRSGPFRFKQRHAMYLSSCRTVEFEASAIAAARAAAGIAEPTTPAEGAADQAAAEGKRTRRPRSRPALKIRKKAAKRPARKGAKSAKRPARHLAGPQTRLKRRGVSKPIRGRKRAPAAAA
jgi:hypothetical protein